MTIGGFFYVHVRGIKSGMDSSEMETRTCAGVNCNMTFRVLVTSDQRHHSSWCDPNFNAVDSSVAREKQKKSLRAAAKKRQAAAIKAVDKKMEARSIPAPKPKETVMTPRTPQLLNNGEMAERLGISSAEFKKLVDAGSFTKDPEAQGWKKWNPRTVRDEYDALPDVDEDGELLDHGDKEERSVGEVINAEYSVVDEPEKIQQQAKRDYLQKMIFHAKQAQDASDHERALEFLWMVIEETNLMNVDT